MALKQLEALYIGRTYHAWKEPGVRPTASILWNIHETLLHYIVSVNTGTFWMNFGKTFFSRTYFLTTGLKRFFSSDNDPPAFKLCTKLTNTHYALIV